MRGGVADADHNLAWALYVLSEDAFAAGAIPELELDLLRYYWTDQLTSYPGDTLANPQQFVSREIDIRNSIRMRAPENRFLLGVENTLSALSTFIFFFRILLRIP